MLIELLWMMLIDLYFHVDVAVVVSSSWQLTILDPENVSLLLIKLIMCWLFLINSLALVIVSTIAREAFLAIFARFQLFAFFAAREVVGKNFLEGIWAWKERSSWTDPNVLFARLVWEWESSFKPSLNSLNLTEGKHYFESLVKLQFFCRGVNDDLLIIQGAQLSEFDVFHPLSMWLPGL